MLIWPVWRPRAAGSGVLGGSDQQTKGRRDGCAHRASLSRAMHAASGSQRGSIFRSAIWDRAMVDTGAELFHTVVK